MHVQSILAISLSVLAVTTSAQPVAINSDGTIVKPGRPGLNRFSLIAGSGDVDKRDPLEANVRTGRPPVAGVQRREPGSNAGLVKPSRPGQKRDPGTDATLIKPSGPNRAGAKREHVDGGVVKPGRPSSKRDPTLIKPGGPGHPTPRDPAYAVKTGRPDKRDPGTGGGIIKPAGPTRAGSRRDPGTAAVVVKSGRPGQLKRDPGTLVKTGRPDKREAEAEAIGPLVKPGRPIDQ